MYGITFGGIDDGARGRPAEIQERVEDQRRSRSEWKTSGDPGARGKTSGDPVRWKETALGRSAYPESSLFRKLFWLLVFLTASGYMSYGIGEIVRAYTSGQTTTSIQMESRETIPFPGVTICPQTYRSIGGMEFSGLFSPVEGIIQLSSEFIDAFQRLSTSDDAPQPETAASEDPELLERFRRSKGICAAPFASAKGDKLQSLEESISSMEMSLGSNKYILDDFSYTEFDIRILHCSFNEEPCSENDFTPEEDGELGDCLTFNYGRDKEARRRDSYAGVRGNKTGWQGLRLALASYFPGSISSAMGHRVIVRKPQDPTYTAEEGFNIDPGTVSYIGLKMAEFERIPPDLGGDCADDSYMLRRFDPDVFSVPNETGYSKEMKKKLDRPWNGRRNVRKDPALVLLTPACEPRPPSSVLDLRGDEGCDDARWWFHRERRLERSFSSSRMGPHDGLIMKLATWMKSVERRRLKSTFCHRPSEQVAVVHVFYETMSVEKTTEIQLYPVSREIPEGLFGSCSDFAAGNRAAIPFFFLGTVVDLHRNFRGLAGPLHRDVFHLRPGAAGVDRGHPLVRLEEASSWNGGAEARSRSRV
ncbi:unnamed protein product [Darwinula stevensoni]|uniref:Uncharacterized protein n=1 Tax=Darwinula stevensoni TaxID=69355 RepID=A0A7R9AB79_9CRUS|nr:unnamed protein product [Darwinula stevensoni]CAG0898885.1 unnamed protein product [Darwinula stevensoni]